MNHIFKYFNKRKENSKGQRNMTLSFDIKSAKCLRAVVTIMAVVSLFVGSCLSTTVEATKHNKWPKGPSKDSITAASAIVMELNTGAILYNKKMDEKHYPASITKIMTTLLCLENSSLDEVVTFSENAVFSIEPGSSHISIVPGEQMKMEDCLYGIMLMSANEACNGVAEHIAGSIDAFVDMMNARAKELGCKNTHFANPNGLYLDNHYTTAYDMALISCEAMKNDIFRKITGTKTYTIPKTNKLEERNYIHNKHNMLYPITYPQYGYEYCIGGKTGYTDIARWTLVTFVKKDDLELVSVVMKTAGPPTISPNEYTDTIKLMDYALENYEKHSINVDMSSGDEEGTYSLFTKYNKIFDTESSPLYVNDNAGVVLPRGVDVSEAEKTVEYYNDKQIVEGVNNIGKITYTYAGKVAGVADIMYDTSRLDEVNLSQNVSDIVSDAEANKQAEEIAKNEKEVSKNDSKKESDGETDNNSKGISLKNVIIWVIIGIVILAIMGYIVYVLVVRARIRKHYNFSRSYRKRRKYSLMRNEKRRRKYMK